MNTSIYQNIATRTAGDIYIGVVGPVRTGKSTFIKRFMETQIIPNIDNVYRRERARDELPQSGSGRTVMTAEPKFVPEEAAQIQLEGGAAFSVRLIDCVGYMVRGALGQTEDDQPRMVTTPWYDHPIPMTEAAEIGTRKVINEHSTIGLVVTTDGTVTDIPREDYVQAEKRAIADMRATGKPYLVVINSREPEGQQAKALKAALDGEFHICCMILDCQAVDAQGIGALLNAMLYSFPMTALRVFLPRWMDALERDHPVKTALYRGLLEAADGIGSLGQAAQALEALRALPGVQEADFRNIDPGSGRVDCVIRFPESMFYEILSARAGMPIESDGQLLELLTELSRVKREYDRLADALASVRATGYGVVGPGPEELKLEKPEVLKKNGSYGVKLRAMAPSIHMIRVDVDTEISPMVGGEEQSKELIEYLGGQEPEKLWQSNIFGKSVYDLIQEGLNAKLLRLPEDVRTKFRGTLGRIVNEGATGLVCLIL